MSKKCLVQKAPNALQQPVSVDETTVLQPQSTTTTYTVRNNRRKVAYYGCCPARALLGAVVLFQTTLIVIWMIREYFYFDFKCAVQGNNNNKDNDRANDGETIEEQTVQPDGSVRRENDRRGLDSGWIAKGRNRVEVFTERGRSERFPRTLRPVRSIIGRDEIGSSRNQRTSSSSSSSTFTGSYLAQLTDNVQNFPASDRSVPPFSHLLFFPSLLASVFSGNYFLERKHTAAKENRLRNLFICLPHCLNLTSTTATDKFISYDSRRRRHRSVRSSENKVATESMESGNDGKIVTGITGRSEQEKRRKMGMAAGHVLRSKNGTRRGRIGVDKGKITYTSHRNPSRTSILRKHRKKPVTQNHIKRLGSSTSSAAGVKKVLMNSEKTRRRIAPVGSTKSSRKNGTRIIKSWKGSDTRKRNGSKVLLQKSSGDTLRGSSRTTGRRNYYLKWSGESWEANEPKPTQKRFHFLSGGSSGDTPRRNKTAPRTSWLDGVVDPQDPHFSNKGEIRFYPGKVARRLKKQRKKSSRGQPKPISARHSQERNVGEEVTGIEGVVENGNKQSAVDDKSIEGLKPAGESQSTKQQAFMGGDKDKQGLELEDRKMKQERKWKSAEDAQRRPVQRLNDPGLITASEFQEFTDKSVRESVTAIPSTASTTTATVTVKAKMAIPSGTATEEFSVIEEPGEQIRVMANIGQSHDDHKLYGIIRPSPATSYTHTIAYTGMDIDVENGFANGPKYYMPTPSTTLEPIDVMETAEERARKRGLFVAQLTVFTNSALCITRSLLDCWCVAECAAAVPFLLGVWCPMRCLFAAHIILDTLFLVLGFIYSITVAVYALILYLLVTDLGLYVVLQWLSFAVAIDMLLIVYLILFVVTLRCCDLVLGERRPYRRNTTTASNDEPPAPYQEIGRPDGNPL